MDWSGVDYCDVFISCLDSHSDGTHSLQSIHCWDTDAMLHFSKSNEETNSSTSWMIWGWVNLKETVSTDIYIYIYAFSRRFYPKRLTVHSGYTCFISMCVPWESNPQPFALLTQCSTTEPQEHGSVVETLSLPLTLSFIHSYTF